MADPIHVWVLDTASVEPRHEIALLSLLQEEERTRWAHSGHKLRQRDYLAAHALLRHMLAAHYGHAPESWRIAIGAHGKPHLIGAPFDIRFNLSHTNGLVAAATTIGAEIGIDAEDLDRPVNLGISERVFSDHEIVWLNDRPPADRAAAFLRLWTIKEAYVKALGHGLGYGLKRLSVRFDPLRLEGGEGEWALHEWRIGERHLVSLAAAHDGPVRLERFALPEPD